MYDYIIVGAGPAGCLIANHLVTKRDARVLLIEAGPEDKGPLFRIPAGFLKFYVKNKHYWDYRAEDEPQLGDRGPRMQNAKVMGGGSSVNAMVHIRGQKQDFDDWGTSTGINDLNGETFWDIYSELEANNTFGGEGHGVSGPLHVSNQITVDTLSHAYVASAQGAGLPYNPDFNSGDPEGVGFYQTNTTQSRRWSAVDAFIRPLKNDKRLTIMHSSLVERIEFEGKKAVGVRVSQAGRSQSIKCSKEVILSAGAIASPKILMLSGIGPAKALQSHGIDVVHDNANVGANLIDHCEAPIAAYTHDKLGYFGMDRGIKSMLAGVQYLAFKTGPAASNGVEAGGFFKSSPKVDRPDMQIFAVPGIYLDKDATNIEESYGLTLNACILRPKSRGFVGLASANPEDLPSIRTGFLSDSYDMDTMIRGLKKMREIMQREPLKTMIKSEALPGAACQTDEQLTDHLRKFTKTVYHPMGTCVLGQKTDPQAVVDEHFSVIGTSGLRVIDASVFPGPVSGNTCMSVYAVAQFATRQL
ncbi:sorbosone dehydrogenase [Phaeobacter sp. LSS9]|uniref:GMC family oxidoreductase n=1 Tax=unclassified Phaeobacter TaxID=2621772 RepID=UPI000E4DE7DD|nr:GMC family oxidoreductase N-terminal domain-containing protein [Phaeobacter sp. LSS9]AXT36248.1 sorbosone dehydrogenase [Phaeobacter sp. LSS9]